MERAAAEHPAEFYAGLTERDAAVHASRALLSAFVEVERRVELVEIAYPLAGVERRVVFALVFEETCCFPILYLFLPFWES